MSDRIQSLIRERLRARQKRERLQLDLIGKEALWHQTISDKLRLLGIPFYEEEWSEADRFGDRELLNYKQLNPQIQNFFDCGTREIVRMCRSCSTVERFEWRCSIKWCPKCSWKISKRREEILEAWCKYVKSPLHMVTTQRNFDVLTPRRIRDHTRNLAKLRRQDFMAHVRGGSVTVELTHEGRGWHLHAHWLVDAEFVDASKLAIAWGELVGQEYAIVKIKPVQSSDYISELAKYCVKPAELAKWAPELIWEFVRAIRGKRFFFTFGELRKNTADLRAAIDAEKDDAACPCGCTRFKFLNLPVV